MNEIFTASDGIEIHTNVEGLLVDNLKGLRIHVIEPSATNALREYFRVERDEELGRWRDPEKPNMVVYPRGGGNTVLVFDETTGFSYLVIGRDYSPSPLADGSLYAPSAERYFAAHPEPEPNPWEEAETGEVWLLTRWGTEGPFLVTGGEFISTDLAVAVDLDDDSITAGHRIWPEREEH